MRIVRLRRRAPAALLALAALWSAGCGPRGDREKAAADVRAFHKSYNASRFDAIYAAAAPSFRQETTLADFSAAMSARHRELGSLQSSLPTVWKTTAGRDGAFVGLTFESRFERGTAKERFEYQIQSDRPRLLRYDLRDVKPNEAEPGSTPASPAR